jgi:phosphatidylserine/phosphatidylglycerophosphate/cardiolipin synthase-like enzyme
LTDRRFIVVIFLVGLMPGAILGIMYSRYVPALVNRSVPSYEIHFSPKGGCADAIAYWVGRANRSVHVLMFTFTLQKAADALASAHARGVEVEVVFDQGQVGAYSMYSLLKSTGVDVRNYTNPNGIMHNKIAIIDEKIVITGSFNWTESAENNNNENLIVIHSIEVAARYEDEFEKIWSESQG